MEKISVRVSSNTLSLSPKSDFSENCRIEIHIFTPIIKEIQQDGGGSIVIKEGFAPVDGGGEISVQVGKMLHGKISGGGVIFYQGNPAIASNISGDGAIERK